MPWIDDSEQRIGFTHGQERDLEKCWHPRISVDILSVMKEWKPEREFKKADFPVPTENRSSGKDRKKAILPVQAPGNAFSGTTDLKPGRVVKAWTPPSVAEPRREIKKSSSADLPVQRAEVRTISPQSNGQGPRLIEPLSREQAEQKAREEADTKHSAADMSGQLLDELVIARPIEATDLLRRWFWEKPAGGTTPQTKIYVILHSMKKDTLVELYRCFTAMERRQMHEIYAKKRTVVKSEVLTARSEFMDRLSQTFT